MDYELLRTISGVAGLLSFVVAFLLVLFWVFKSKTKEDMKDHANMIFKEDD